MEAVVVDQPGKLVGIDEEFLFVGASNHRFHEVTEMAAWQVKKYDGLRAGSNQMFHEGIFHAFLGSHYPSKI